MDSKFFILGVASFAAVLSGCGAEPLDAGLVEDVGMTDESRMAIQVANGAEMNGTQINGTFSNGVKDNGVKDNGVKDNGVKDNGTGLQAYQEDVGAIVTGQALEGVTLTATLGTGPEIQIYVDEVRWGEIPGRYTYVFRQGDHNGPNICVNDQTAIPLNGRWDYVTGDFIDDPTQWTVACRGAALAKCVELGYSRHGTWDDNGTPRFNHDLHQACSRMIRADYCGNGVSHTHDGTLVDIFDKKGVQLRTTDTSLKLEAEWGPDGAKCINHKRWVSAGVGDVESYVSATCSFRAVSCGTSWGDGVLRNASGQTDHDATTFAAWTW